jgi:hypothetical protein
MALRVRAEGARKLAHVLALLSLTLTMLAAPCSAQRMVRVAGAADVPLSAELRGAIVDSVAAALNEIYVFPDVARDMEKHIRSAMKRGAYDEIDAVGEFARRLTEELQGISHDRHLNVLYVDPASMSALVAEQEDEELAKDRALARLRRDNFMFRKVELLDGNVGYLRLDGFVDASFSGPTAVAAMNFLANADAIIVDLRGNGGGSPSLIQLITSYFLEEPTHLNSFYIRKSDTTKQFWTSAYVPGPRMTDVDLYVLTSPYTFSGAEEFTYNLKNLERATIIGETTGGGAHPVHGRLYPSLNLSVNVPFGRAVNPISKTNWEGTGVEPHIEVPQDQALARAHLEALRKLREEETDEERLLALDWAIDGLEAQSGPAAVDESILASYAGAYGPRKLTFENGMLYYQREPNPVMQAIPMSPTLFRFEGLDYFRLEVVLDSSGSPVKLIGHYADGHTDESERTDG